LIVPALFVPLGVYLCMTVICSVEFTGASPWSYPRGHDGSCHQHNRLRGCSGKRNRGFLPYAPAGWTEDEPAGASWTVEDGQWTWASRDGKGDARASIMIRDSACLTAWATGSRVTRSSRSRRPKATTGRLWSAATPPPREYFTKPASYGTWVGVNERFMVCQCW